jgi:hypothetical protein
MSDIKNLMELYMEKANLCIMTLADKCNGGNPLRACRVGIIKTHGCIYIPDECTYSMHGIGFTFTTADWSIDVDLGEDGLCAGFDAWRLARFAQSLGGGNDWPLAGLDLQLKLLRESGYLEMATQVGRVNLFRISKT